MTMFHRLALIAFAFCIMVSSAQAVPQFFKQYVAKYSDAADGYEDTVKEAKCLVCHQGKKKKNLNPYGEAVHGYLHKKDKKDVEKIIAALESVAAESTDAENEEAPTFGDRIAEGKLPGGELENLKEEPEE